MTFIVRKYQSKRGSINDVEHMLDLSIPRCRGSFSAGVGNPEYVIFRLQN